MATLGAAWVRVSSFAAALAPRSRCSCSSSARGRGLRAVLRLAALLPQVDPAHRTTRDERGTRRSTSASSRRSARRPDRSGSPSRPRSAVYAASCFLAAALFWRTIRDPERHESEVRRGGIRRLPWNRAFVTVLVVNGVYLWMIGAVFSTLVPLFGTSDEVGPRSVAWGSGSRSPRRPSSCLYSAGHATDRRGRRAVLIPALAGLALTTAAFGFVSTPVGFMVATLLGVASGYSCPAGADAVGRDAGGAQGVGGRRLPVRGRPRVRDRAAGRRVVGVGVRVHRIVRDQRDPGRRRAGARALDPRDDARAARGRRGQGPVAMQVEAFGTSPRPPSASGLRSNGGRSSRGGSGTPSGCACSRPNARASALASRS